ncbi:MAG: NmrA family NAD(P)-binding protein [Gammaproteobacteria bacterium]|jgi:uncharacterized protein YbjT (DUF2867 family)|nr:NmrA family NAD(P)-binding protein [Gammaproteobacteria bacterium]
MKAAKVFLCVGAGGSQGSAMARQLLKAGYVVTTIARSKEKCDQLIKTGLDARLGDLADLESLTVAIEGAEYVAFVLPLERDKDKLALYTENVIEASKSAGIKNLVFNTSSRFPQHETIVPGFGEKRMVDALLRDSGLPYICLRPTIYMENLAAPWSITDVNDNSCVKYPIADDRRVIWNSVEDVARYVVAALEKTELAGRIFDIGGPQAVTGKEIAQQFSSALGRDVIYKGITPPEFAKGLVPFLGETQGMGMVSYYEYVNENPENWGEVSDDLALLNYEPKDNFETWVSRLTPDVFR